MTTLRHSLCLYLCLYLFLFLFPCVVPLSSQPLTLIAHYPLNCTPNDTTGHFGPMRLDSVQFLDGALYCAGRYGTEIVQTPVFPISIYRGFNVSVQFKTVDITATYRPVLVFGGSYRWIGAELRSDTTFGLLHTNNQRLTSTVRYTPGVWHQLLLTYDSSSQVGSLYLDGALAGTATFPIDHGDTDLDRILMAYNPSNATIFKGYLRNLKVFGQLPVTGFADANALPAGLRLEQNYPNPFSGRTTIVFSLQERSRIRIAIFDLLGREICRIFEGMQEAGRHQLPIATPSLPPGIYRCGLETVRERTAINIILLNR